MSFSKFSKYNDIAVRRWHSDLPKWKHLENENENFQNNFRMISNVFDFMNMRKEFHKMLRDGNKHNCPDNNNPVSTELHHVTTEL